MFVVGVECNVAHTVGRNAIIGDRVEFDFLSNQVESEDAVGDVGALHRNGEMGAGLPLQALAHLIGGAFVHTIVVDHQNLIATLQTGARSGAIFVGSRNLHPAALVLRDIRADAAVFTGGKRQKIVLLLFGNKFPVGVNVFQHRFDGGVNVFFCVEGVDVESG